MANVEGAYCATDDLRTGDIATPSYTSKEQYILNAAEEIEAALGHLYITPMVIPDLPVNRPSVLFLKKLNWLLASGRLILDVAAAGESDNLHAYGKRMLDEATVMLLKLTTEEIVLIGVPPIEVDPHEQGDFTGPAIFNEDPDSLVEDFYRRQRPGFSLSESYPFGYKAPVTPYGP